MAMIPMTFLLIDRYAYVATDDVSRDVVIIDLNTNTEVGYFNDSFWWGTAQGVFVKGNVGYAVIGTKTAHV
jgi:hypothetical protein